MEIHKAEQHQQPHKLSRAQFFFDDAEDKQQQHVMEEDDGNPFALTKEQQLAQQFPFWLGREEEDHIRHIVLSYEQALGIYSFHNEAESQWPRGESVQLPLFIGKITRNVLSIDSDKYSTSSGDSVMETVDVIDVYYRDLFVRRGASMPLYQRVHVRTLWDVRDGVPIHFSDCSSTEYKYLCKYGPFATKACTPSSHNTSTFTLYSFPKFRNCCQNHYRSYVGNENLLVSYGSLLDGCLQKVTVAPTHGRSDTKQ